MANFSIFIYIRLNRLWYVAIPSKTAKKMYTLSSPSFTLKRHIEKQQTLYNPKENVMNE